MDPMAVTTLGDLREISHAHPDAPKWWLGDWANEGTRRFDVTIEQAVEAGRLSPASPRAGPTG